MVMDNFVVFEGIDGAGTSTQIKMLKERPESSQIVFSAEPTGTATGKFLREILGGKIKVAPQTAAYLFAADRAEHIWGDGGITESIESGKAVVSDRYFFSSLAYQGVTCGEELPEKINSFFPLPKLLFFFEIEPEKSLARIQERDTIEIYENKSFLDDTAARYRKIIAGYKAAAEIQPEAERMQVVEIDATKTKEEISEIIWSYMKELPIFRK